jgi:phage recombination protein Bet
MEDNINQETVVERKSTTLATLLEKRGVSQDTFRVIKEVLYPNVAEDKTLLMALDYCKERKLDIMKRTIQIVPIWDSKKHKMVDTIWPSISEIRITASRTGKYAGKDKAIFGEDITENLGGMEVTYPKWCEVVVYKIVDGMKCAFSSNELFWKETYKTAKKDTDSPNAMWKKRTREQLAKCAEAAALRAAFPEEIGSDYIGEEAFLPDQEKDVTPKQAPIDIDNIPDQTNDLFKED